MYDEPRKSIWLTDDEIAILVDLLERKKDYAVSIGEEITIDTLLEKLDR